RALDLAAPAEQVPEREVGLERVLVDLRHLHEQLERLVRLPVQDEVQAADVVRADTRRQVAIAVYVDAIGETDRAERDENRRKNENAFSQRGMATRQGRTNWNAPDCDEHGPAEGSATEARAPQVARQSNRGS